MGMSASQARFLGLTARKSNVEYQGQQVNQQRTTLANESAGLFNQMASLQVPVPPSATDFYSMAYTFAGATANEEYRILNWNASTRTDLGAYDIDVKITTNDTGIKEPHMPAGTQVVKTPGEGGAEDTYEIIVGGKTYSLTKSDKDVYGLSEDNLTTKVGDKTVNYTPSYTYTRNGRTYFVPQSLITAMFADGSAYGVTTDGATGKKTATVTTENQADTTESYYKGDNTVENKTIQGVNFDTDDTGRFTKIYYYDDDGEKHEVNLEIEEVHDTQGYDQAMEEYKYKKMVYDRTIDDINNRTEVIQYQDKVLELNLKQLDTEQEAIQTEMDAVKKVIDKNVENTFKTFA